MHRHNVRWDRCLVHVPVLGHVPDPCPITHLTRNGVYVMGEKIKEMFPLCDEEGNFTGELKERSAVHRDGDLHGGSYMDNGKA